jgi:hypothetical protein
VILPDVDLRLHAYNSDSPVHGAAKSWWERLLNVVLLGFIRIVTHQAVVVKRLPVRAVCDHLRSWLARPQVAIVHPGDRHAQILFGLLESPGSAGSLTTDAHLAALAIEHQAELHSTDADFARFPGLRWSNPVRDRGGR